MIDEYISIQGYHNFVNVNVKYIKINIFVLTLCRPNVGHSDIINRTDNINLRKCVVLWLQVIQWE